MVVGIGRFGQALVAVAVCACVLAAMAGWHGSGRRRSDALLSSDSTVAGALQAALRGDGQVQQLQGEVKTLDSIRNGMWEQMARQPADEMRGRDRLQELVAMVHDTQQLQVYMYTS